MEPIKAKEAFIEREVPTVKIYFRFVVEFEGKQKVIYVKTFNRLDAELVISNLFFNSDSLKIASCEPMGSISMKDFGFSCLVIERST